MFRYSFGVGFPWVLKASRISLAPAAAVLGG
jgi:hypothetical protein